MYSSKKLSILEQMSSLILLSSPNKADAMRVYCHI